MVALFASSASVLLAILIISESLLPNISMPEIVPLLDATRKLGAGVLSENFYLVPTCGISHNQCRRFTAANIIL